MGLVNRYSFLMLSVLLIACGVVYGILVDADQGSMITLGIVTALLIWWVLARRGKRAPANPDKRIRRARGAGRPVAVYFYSDWSLDCILTRPFSTKAERVHKSHFDFIYIDISHPEAAAAMESLDAGVGEWLLFDGAGRPAGTARRITPAMLTEVMEKAV